MARTALARHPAFPSDAVQRVSVSVNRNPGGSLDFLYDVEGSMSRIRVPESGAPQRKDELWKHTCCEAFVSHGDSGGYYEFNFSPSNEWAIYSFNGYRDGMASVVPMKKEWLPRVNARKTALGLELEARVHLASIPLAPAHSALCFALSAVIEEEGGELSYWALNHPASHPDFHNPKSRVLEI